MDKEYLSQVLGDFDFIKQTKVSGDYQTLRASMVLTSYQVDNGPDEKILSMIKDELLQSLFRKLFRDVLDNSKIELLDLRTNSLTPSVSTSYTTQLHITNNIVYNLSRLQGKTMVTNGRICSDLQDNSSFSIYPQKNKFIGAFPYLVGSLVSKSLWVDPFLRYTDNSILVFDSIDIEFGDIKENIINDATFAPKIEVELNYKSSISNSDILYIFTDEYQDNLSVLKSREREEKINYILGENSGSKQNF